MHAACGVKSCDFSVKTSSPRPGEKGGILPLPSLLVWAFVRNGCLPGRPAGGLWGLSLEMSWLLRLLRGWAQEWPCQESGTKRPGARS